MAESISHGITDDDADRLIEAHGGFGRGRYPCYTEADLSAMERVIYTDRIDEYTEVEVSPSGASLTLAELTRWCTPHQKRVIRAARAAVRDARHSGRTDWQRLLAELLGVRQPAVSRILQRIDDRIEARRAALLSREPSALGRRLWHEEQASKRRQVYRRPVRGWVSAYLHDRRRRQ